MRKIIAMMLVLFLIAVGFAGCGNGETPEQPEAPIEAEAPERQEEPAEEPMEEDQGEVISEDGALISVILAEDGSVLSLGDQREAFEAALGEGTEVASGVTYLGGHFAVIFEDNAARMFIAMGDALEQLEFPVFDPNRSISSLMLDLTLGGDFVEADNRQYVRIFEVDGVQYSLLVQMEVTDGALSHVGTMVLGVA